MLFHERRLAAGRAFARGQRRRMFVIWLVMALILAFWAGVVTDVVGGFRRALPLLLVFVFPFVLIGLALHRSLWRS